MVPKDDGPADVRGHVCNHERKPSGDPIEQSSPSSWVPYDNEQHTRSVTAYQTWVCSYCDAMGQTYLGPETRYERHYHVHVMTVKMTVDGVEQTYYFGLRLDEFGLWQMIELAENEVGEDTLVQK